jgi:hypothetical protein
MDYSIIAKHPQSMFFEGVGKFSDAEALTFEASSGANALGQEGQSKLSHANAPRQKGQKHSTGTRHAHGRSMPWTLPGPGGIRSTTADDSISNMC